MEALKEYFKNTLGIDLEMKPISKKKLGALPFALVNLYEFCQVEIYQRDLLLVVIKDEFTAERLRKHLDIIGQTFAMPCAAVINSTEAYTRSRLIEKRVPFIVPGKQMYLPDFLIDLKEYGVKAKIPPTVMQPAVQLLLLYHLQVESLEGINFKGIADKLLYNGMTITRAAYYLHHTGLCTLEGTKDKQLHFEPDKKKLWEAAEPLMTSPIKKTTYYTGWVSDDNLSKSNVTALSHYTDINPDVVDYYALRPGYTKFIEGANLKNFGPMEGNICIEEWKYDPACLSKNEYVDPLSLYLCFRGNTDERIEMALEQLIEKYEW